MVILTYGDAKYLDAVLERVLDERRPRPDVRERAGAHWSTSSGASRKLDAHRAALQRRAAYAYGKGLLRAARRVLLGVLRERPEHWALALLCVSLLPWLPARARRLLKRAQARLD